MVEQLEVKKKPILERTDKGELDRIHWVLAKRISVLIGLIIKENTGSDVRKGLESRAVMLTRRQHDVGMALSKGRFS